MTLGMFRSAAWRALRLRETPMKRMIIGAAMLALVTVSGTGMAAQSGQDRRSSQQQHEGRQWHEQAGRSDNGRHRGWGNNRGNSHRWARGERMGYNDWRRAPRVDYRQFRLRRPPQGYEWRRSYNRFVLVSRSSGYIYSVVLYSRR